LPTYILPIFPPLAVLIGRVLGPRLAARNDLPLGRWVFAAVFGVLALAVPLVYLLPAMRENGDIGPHLDAVAPIVFPMAVIFALGSLVALIAPKRHGEKAAFIAIVITAALGWTGISLVASEADPNSVKPVAEMIQKYRHHDELVASYGTFFYDLPVYLNDKIAVVGNTAEFDFGMTQEDVSRYVMQPKAFSDIWGSKDLTFMVVRTRLFSKWEQQGAPERMCVIARTERAVAVANQPIYDGDRMICDPWYDADSSAASRLRGGDKVLRKMGILPPPSDHFEEWP
jgi:4-amino-4-deoxy-L-arabinose transferase-like glycosyltransferase